MYRTAQFVLALMNVAISVPSIVLHVALLTAISQTRTLRERTSFQILFAQNVSNVIQLAIHSLVSFHVLFSVPINEKVNTITGFFIDWMWASLLYQQFLLSVNRFSIITLKSLESGFERRGMQLMLALSWVGGFCCALADRSVDAGLKFDTTTLSWKMPKDPQSRLYWSIYNFQLALITLTFFVCVVIVGSIVRLSRKLEDRRTSWIRPVEARVFVQTVLESSLTLSSVYLWRAANDWTGDWVAALVNLQWIVICALPPFLAVALIEFVPLGYHPYNFRACRKLRKSIQDLGRTQTSGASLNIIVT